MNLCRICDAPLPRGPGRRYYCKAHYWTVVRIQSLAGSAVTCAIRHGLLPAVKTHQCVDCGAPATQYEHRDYSKPLQVDPVCKPCNYHRGPADWSAYREARPS